MSESQTGKRVETHYQRMVYLGGQPYQIEVEDLNAGEGRVRTPTPYKAHVAEVPEIVAYGVTQEGAMVEAERLLKERLAEEA